MTQTILSLLLSAQLLCAAPQPQALSMQASPQAAPARLWWSLIDPELSLWFARLPDESSAPESTPDRERVIWDWSWRGFLAAIWGRPLVKGEAAHA